jgi:hypothetical protein
MAKGVTRKVQRARRRIQAQIASSINGDDKYSRGLAYEGYNGGYMQALDDVLLALNGANPNRNGWWDEKDESE